MTAPSSTAQVFHVYIALYKRYLRHTNALKMSITSAKYQNFLAHYAYRTLHTAQKLLLLLMQLLAMALT